MKKFLTIFSVSVLSLFLLSCLSFIVFLASVGDKKLGAAAAPIRKFATLPQTIGNVLTSQELKGIPPTFIPIDDGTSDQDPTINTLEYDLYGLTSYYDLENNQWVVRLFNFRNDATLHEWFYEAQNFREDEVHNFDDSKPKHSLLFADKSIVMSLRQTRNLTKIDSASNVVWTNDDFIFHHSLNFDADSNVWVCSTRDAATRVGTDPLNFVLTNVDGVDYGYRDDQISQINQRTGETMYHKSLSEIFIENGHSGLLYGMGKGRDPIHVNDIQPALTDGPYWQRDDLFISMRNRSLVMHYRPATNKIIKLIRGPLIHQHDVNFFSDHEVSIFNNNHAELGQKVATSEEGHETSLKSSEIIIYDYENDTFRSYYQDILNKNNLFTPTAGIHHILSNGDLFIDLEDFGRILVVDQASIKYRRIFPTEIEGYKHLTNWTRTYEELPFN